MAAGGIVEYIAAFAKERGIKTQVVLFNAKDKFYPCASRGELLALAGLDGAGMAGVCAGLTCTASQDGAHLAACVARVSVSKS